MDLQVYAIFDDGVKAFMTPFFVPHKAIAIRSFMDLVRDTRPDNVLANHKADYSLWKIGEYNDKDGMFTQDDGPHKVMLAVEVEQIRTEPVEVTPVEKENGVS